MRRIFAVAASALVALNFAFTYVTFQMALKKPAHVTIAQVTSAVGELNKQTALKIIQATVKVETKEGSSGTGFFIYSGQRKDDPNDKNYYSYVLTCSHVLHGHKNVIVREFTYIDDREIVAEIINSKALVVLNDTANDLAVIELKSRRKAEHLLPLLTPSEYMEMALDDPIYVSGCPIGYPPFITRGNVGCYGLPPTYSLSGYIMISAPIMFGNSGGPVITSSGKVLGVISRIGLIQGTPYPHTAFATPVWVVARFLGSNGYAFIFDSSETLDKMLKARKVTKLY